MKPKHTFAVRRVLIKRTIRSMQAKDPVYYHLFFNEVKEQFGALVPLLNPLCNLERILASLGNVLFFLYHQLQMSCFLLENNVMKILLKESTQLIKTLPSLLQLSLIAASHHFSPPCHEFGCLTNVSLPPKKPTSIPNRMRDEIPHTIDKSMEIR
jgi:hypothetical protein